jgi:hypothetical protein
MQLSHTHPVRSAVFRDPNLVSSAGLVPILALARSAGLARLADQHLSVPTDKGANAGLKVSSLVAGMVAGADSIDDMALLRHGGMGKVFAGVYAPSMLGSFLRSFTFGHVRQLDAVAGRFLGGLAARTPVVAGIGEQVMVDIDDTIIEVHGYAKQGSGYGYSGVRGLNAILATLTTKDTAPVIVAQRLRKGSCGSPRGAKRLVTDALATLKKLSADLAFPTEHPHLVHRTVPDDLPARLIPASQVADLRDHRQTVPGVNVGHASQCQRQTQRRRRRQPISAVSRTSVTDFDEVVPLLIMILQ